MAVQNSEATKNDFGEIAGECFSGNSAGPLRGDSEMALTLPGDHGTGRLPLHPPSTPPQEVPTAGAARDGLPAAAGQNGPNRIGWHHEGATSRATVDLRDSYAARPQPRNRKRTGSRMGRPFRLSRGSRSGSATLYGPPDKSREHLPEVEPLGLHGQRQQRGFGHPRRHIHLEHMWRPRRVDDQVHPGKVP